MSKADLITRLRAQHGEAIHSEAEFRGETSLTVDRRALHGICQTCRDELGFDYLLDIASVDHEDTHPRFEMVYELYSMSRGIHLRLKVPVPDDDPAVPTVSDLWPTANWHEREVYDMMGLRFTGHPDLRRILMWDGYPYHPLRKEFPLAGKPSDVPDIAFTGVAPLEGGPFVTAPTTGNTQVREPRARTPEDPPSTRAFIAEP